MFTYLEQILLDSAENLPLEIFAFGASIIEEIIAPIPSPTVMILTGSLAQMQEYVPGMLVTLAVIGAVGKVIGAYVVYVITDRAEDVFTTRFGRLIGVTHDEIEAFGRKLTGGIRDYILLTVLRALPVVPSVIVSAGCGVLKVPMNLFLVTTFFGTIVRDGLYLYAGYVGVEVLMSMVEGATTFETYVELFVLISAGAFLVYRFLRKR